MKTNDLRFIKTEKLLQEKYLELKMKSQAPVKVSELCSLALINKTTFYDHYKYIENLHDTVCRQTVNNLLETCTNLNALFTDTRAFIKSLILVARQKEIKALFYDDIGFLVDIIEQKILGIYLNNQNNKEWRLRLRFAIGGAIRLMTDCSGNAAETEEHINMLVIFVNEILSKVQNETI